jgi:hypothetical protein
MASPLQGNIFAPPYNQHFPMAPNPTLLQRRTSAGMSYEQIGALINLLWDFFSQMDLPSSSRFIGYDVAEMRRIHQPIYESLCNMATSIEASYYHGVAATPDTPLVRG